MSEARIVIVGAGIGGLASALALQRSGFRPVVCERASRLREIGAGLTIASNGSHVLAELGLGRLIRERAVTPRRGAVLHYRSGATLVDIPRGDAQWERFGAPYCQIHRVDLHAALVAAVSERDPDCIRLGYEVADVDQDAKRARVVSVSGETLEADLLVGCDGIRSTVRARLFGEQPPLFTGYVAWRGLVPMECLPRGLIEPESAVWIGPGHFLTRYLIRSGKLLNYVAIARTDRWADEGWAVPSTVDAVLREFRDFEPRARTVLASTPAAQCFKWGIFEREPLDTWTRNRITLLGDAAHPMTPFLGQGAVMALEDAMILARCIALASATEEALVRYERARIERTTRVMLESRRNGEQLTGFDPDAYTEEAHRNEESLGLAEYDAVRVPI